MVSDDLRRCSDQSVSQQLALPTLKQHSNRPGLEFDYCETTEWGGGGGSHLLWFFNDFRSVVDIGVSALKGWDEKQVVNTTFRSE